MTEDVVEADYTVKMQNAALCSILAKPLKMQHIAAHGLSDEHRGQARPG
jgi:hypothetical protein